MSEIGKKFGNYRMRYQEILLKCSFISGAFTMTDLLQDLLSISNARLMQTMVDRNSQEGEMGKLQTHLETMNLFVHNEAQSNRESLSCPSIS
jgi:hypothetical protein